jgi:hypothetical protein
MLSKYLVECTNYIINVEHYLSPMMKLRVLEGSFVNVKGGKGNNVESDLLQEHALMQSEIRKYLLNNLVRTSLTKQ